MSKELLDNIESHFGDEKSNLAITSLIGALDAKRDLELPKELKEKLESMGNTPLAEPKVNIMQKEIEKKIEEEEISLEEAPIDLLEAVYSMEDLEKFHKNGVTLAEFYKLGEAINSRVFDFKYLDEKNNLIFKEVESHEKMELLSFIKRKEIRKLNQKVKNSVADTFQKLREARKLTGSNDDKSLEKVQEIISKVTALNEKAPSLQAALNEKAMQYSGLDKKDMSEWEQNLAIAKVIEMADDRYTPPMGKN